MGAKSLGKIWALVPIRAGFAALPLLAAKRVYPSFGEFATNSVPIIALAPGLFSTIIEAPIFSVNFWAIILVITSVLPPEP